MKTLDQLTKVLIGIRKVVTVLHGVAVEIAILALSLIGLCQLLSRR